MSSILKLWSYRRKSYWGRVDKILKYFLPKKQVSFIRIRPKIFNLYTKELSKFKTDKRMHNCLLQSRLDDFSSDEDDDDAVDEDESFKQNLKNGLKESNVGNGILLYILISTKFSKRT